MNISPASAAVYARDVPTVSRYPQRVVWMGVVGGAWIIALVSEEP